MMERPLHPYTGALLSAVPSLRRKRSERVRLAGEPPKPTNPPAGCRFHPRCPIAREICSRQAPEWTEWTPGRFAACHFALDLYEGRTTLGTPASERITA
jgi:oligopeptide/dipeptide ABC transporter ATP-binding protein